MEITLSHFTMPVDLYMSSPAHTIAPGESIRSAQTRLSDLSISSLAVVDDGTQKLLGVISITDLIRLGRKQAGSRAKAALLTLPDSEVSHVMSESVVSVAREDEVAMAARKMVEGHVHRIYVEEAGRLVGVLSTRDIMLAIRDKRSAQPISDWMSSPAFTVRCEEPISLATERLEKAGVSGLIVVDKDWPVGLFRQHEALESRDEPRDTPVEAVMSCAMLALDRATPLHRAAAQAADLKVRRIIAMKNQRVEGILTGLDFARVAS